jgi:16S rRNA (cytosine967-C5)-methyltransferase
LNTEPSTKRKQLWKLFHTYVLWKGLNLPDWDVFERHDEIKIPSTKDLPLVIKESFPDWLDEIASEQIGEKWPDIARELNGDSSLVIRANTLKIARVDLLKELSKVGIEATPLPWNSEGLIINKRIATTKTELFQKGFFEIQDGGSQKIAPLLNLNPGMTMIDACAGAGGKTLHAATLMGDVGKIIAMDVEPRKLSELKKRAVRQGFQSIEVKGISPAAILDLHETADRLLLDVPCSGTGVIKRKPDTKWKLKPEYLESVIHTQAVILKDYSRMLKRGGLMVYATCSILPAENEHQVGNFIEENSEFSLIEQQTVNPIHGSDGYFMALLRKE